MFTNKYLKKVYKDIVSRNKGEKEFLQAVGEVFNSLEPVVEKHPEIEKYGIMERLTEPERFIHFQVAWVDDKNRVQVNRGYRIQFNSALGPYAGGVRFDKSVDESIMKFLGFEQTFKNALTGLPIGGSKGGSDFDPKGKSDLEIMRFCQSYVNELHRHIGSDTDVPTGDIGVGAREIGFMFGRYKKITNEFNGSFSGKGLSYGGSKVRKEATGYGLCYFTKEMLASINESFKDKRVIISGAGKVAMYACKKATELGAKVVGMSNSKGYIHDESGINYEIIEKFYKENTPLSEYVKIVKTATYSEGARNMWINIKADIALPCATQNEIDEEAARGIVRNGVRVVAEGANMPNTPEAIKVYKEAGILYAPGKASNAGGVATSALEMSQNSQRYSWSFTEVDELLEGIMKDIYNSCVESAKEYGYGYDLVAGANIASFKKLTDAMLAQGVS